MTIQIAAWDRPLARTGPFSCGEPALDRWWREQAGQAERRGSVRIRLAVIDGRVAGFCAVTVGAHDPGALGGRWRKRPAPVPVVIIARLAVASPRQGSGVGTALLLDTFRRLDVVAGDLGFEATTVTAKDPGLVPYYSRFGFQPSHEDDPLLYLRVKDLPGAGRNRWQRA
jgi:GNAT superfamily N-acetyltransferase